MNDEYILSLATPCINAEALSRTGDYLCYFWQRPSRAHQVRDYLESESFPGFVRSSLPEESKNFPFLPVCRIPLIKKEARERCAKVLIGINTTLVALWPAVQFSLPYSSSNAMALSPWIRLIGWVLESYAGSGEPFVAERLKGMCAWARYLASPHQLYPPPPPLRRFPFADAAGRFVPSRLFCAGLASKAASSRSLIRLSRLSRALPPGDVNLAVEAERKHLKAMTASASTPSSILAQVGPVVLYRFPKKVCGIEDAGVSLSNSACLERGRREGGSMNYLRGRLWYHFPSAFYERTGVAGLSEEDTVSGGFQRASVPNEGFPQEAPRVARIFHETCVREAFSDTYGQPRRLQDPYVDPAYPDDEPDPPSPPAHRVVAVPDRGGFKVRVVTAGPAALQALAHIVRRVFYESVLSRTPSRWSLIENGVPQWFEQLPSLTELSSLSGMGPLVLLSSDLSSATDLFPHDIVEEINNQIEHRLSGEQRKCANWLAWRSLSGPQRLLYKFRETKNCQGAVEPNPVISTCGNLMGTAPSWFHLNMFNLIMFESAWLVWSDASFREDHPVLMSLSSRDEISDQWQEIAEDALTRLQSYTDLWSGFRRLQYRLKVNLDNMVCIIGDDLGAVCPYGVALLYEIFVSAANGKLSVGKHFVQPASPGNFLLIAEEVAIMDYRGKLVHHPIEHLRGISSAQTAFDRRDEKCLWHQIGTTLSSAVAHCNESRRRALLSLAHQQLHSWKEDITSTGLPLYLPSQLGGLGWPHPRGLIVALERLPDRCVRHYRLLRGFRSDPVRFVIEIAKTSACWATPNESNHTGALLDLYRPMLLSLGVSRNAEGELAEACETHPIGLYPSDRTDSAPLTEVLSCLVLAGLPVRYLIREPLQRLLHSPLMQDRPDSDAIALVSGAPDLPEFFIESEENSAPFSVGSAARRYASRVKELDLINVGYKPPPLQPAKLLQLVEEDLQLIDCLWVVPTREISTRFPTICCEAEEGSGEFRFLSKLLSRDPHPVG